ncbi:phage structural protein [Devosia sp. H5989]|nr:phage structural protein [Devosia sp. H5989]
MAFTADEIANIANSSLETFLDKGKVWAQNIQDKPMLAAFQVSAGSFTGGKEVVSLGVKSGQGGGQLQGFDGDDQVSYYNPTGTKRVKFPWKEHHIGTRTTLTELKTDGINVVENGASQTTEPMSDREAQALANNMDEKNEALMEDYNASLDSLIHLDGSADSKALAGIGAFILDVPNVGQTGGLPRAVYPWWTNRAATAAFGGAGGQGAITVNPANGGALIEFMDKEWRQLGRYAGGISGVKLFAGSDFIDGYKKELRSNGFYSQDMSKDDGTPDGSMKDPKHAGKQIVYDPTLDDMGLSKRLYAIDMSRKGIRLLYMEGNRMKRHNPARPYDRYVIYQGITTTAVMVARRLRSSGVYDIA